MKNLFLCICLLTAFFQGASQKKYHIIYDKPSDVFKFFEVKNNQGNSEEIPITKHMPKLSRNDMIQIDVTNFNPFLYYVDIEESNKVTNSGKQSKADLLFKIATSGLGFYTGFFSSIGDIQSKFSQVREIQSKLKGTRGDEGTDAFNTAELKLYFQENKKLSESINSYFERYDEYKMVLSEIYNEDLQSQKDNLISRLKQCYTDYYDPIATIDEAHSSSTYHYYKAGIKNPKITEQEDEVDRLVKSFKEKEAELKNSYSKETIKNYINMLEHAKFSFSKTIQITKYSNLIIDASKDDPTSQENVDIAKIVKIKFYNIKEFASSPLNDESIFDDVSGSTYVKYYYSNRFWTPQGNISDTVCIGCMPVLLAEGLYDGTPPRNLFDIFKEISSGDEYKSDRDGILPLKDQAKGKWFFYNKDGKLERISLQPEIVKEKRNTNLNRQPDSSYLNDHLSRVKQIELPIKGAMKLNWQMGFYRVGSFASRYNYGASYNIAADSFRVTKSSQPNTLMCVGVLIDVQLNSTGKFIPSFSVGAAFDYWKDRELHFLLGGGLKLKRLPFLGFTGGLALTRVNALGKNYQAGQSYAVTEYSAEEIQKKKYAPGYYFGVNINF